MVKDDMYIGWSTFKKWTTLYTSLPNSITTDERSVASKAA